MIELFEQDIKEDGRTSSKGNQLKWKKNNVWYKQDYLGYEGLVEYIISHLLAFSSLKKDEYVIYETEQIKYKKQIKLGCKSLNFLKDDEEFVTLERLYQNQYGTSLYVDMFKIGEVEDRIRFLLSFINQYVNKTEFGIFINKIVLIDMFFRNEDRHMNNIGLIRKNNGTYRLCPLFDNGDSLLADLTINHVLKDDIIKAYEECQSKLFSPDFEKADDAINNVLGPIVDFSFTFTVKDVQELLDKESYYDKQTKDRVLQIIKHAMQKYAFLIKK